MTWILVSKDGSSRGRHWELSGAPFVLGRALDCDIVIDDPSVSRRHCKLFVDGDALHIEDLGSSHRALVNGEAVQHGPVGPGDTLSIGATTFVVSRGLRDGIPQNSENTEDVTLDLFGAATLDGVLPEGRPQSNIELVHLFKLGRSLSQSRTRAELDEVVANHLKHTRGYDDMAIALTGQSADAPRWFPETAKTDSIYPSVFEKAMAHQRPLLSPYRTTAGGRGRLAVVMAAPICVGGNCLGALLAQTSKRTPVFDEADLNQLLSVAHVIAPYYQTLEQLATLEETVADLDQQAGERGPLLGKSRALSKVRGLIRDVARTKLNVLITGETGTGKELAAQMIHRGSDRADGPFIAVNCAAIPDHLFESEMFGHERGAFTSADKKRKGRFPLADGGTLFLDEIGELSPENQARLLRVLESGHFHSVGAEEESHSDVRVVSATNRDLKRAIRDGRFRRDLFHRICAVEIALPALRQRPSDIPLLAQHFASELAPETKGPRPQLTEDALAYLQALPWSGNVRELRNAIERATALAKAPQITLHDFTFLNNLLQNDPDEAQPAFPHQRLAPLAEIERNHITHVLEQCNYNVSKAARVLGIHRNTLHNKIAEYGIGG